MPRSFGQIIDTAYINVLHRLIIEARQIDKYNKRIKNRNRTKKRGC